MEVNGVIGDRQEDPLERAASLEKIPQAQDVGEGTWMIPRSCPSTGQSWEEPIGKGAWEMFSGICYKGTGM